VSDTPRTDAATRMAFSGEYMVPIQESQKLERELAEARKAATHQQNGRTASAQGWALLFEAAIEQRDMLAEAMTKYMDHHMRYGFVTAVENHKVEQALAAVKGGSHE